MTRARSVLFLCAAAILSAGGCENRMLWSYRDDPYLHQYANHGEAYCLQKTKSLYADNRQIALRVLAEEAARAQAAGDAESADRLVGVVLGRFEAYRNPAIRSCIWFASGRSVMRATACAACSASRRDSSCAAPRPRAPGRTP